LIGRSCYSTAQWIQHGKSSDQNRTIPLGKNVPVGKESAKKRESMANKGDDELLQTYYSLEEVQRLQGQKRISKTINCYQIAQEEKSKRIRQVTGRKS